MPFLTLLKSGSRAKRPYNAEAFYKQHDVEAGKLTADDDDFDVNASPTLHSFFITQLIHQGFDFIKRQHKALANFKLPPEITSYGELNDYFLTTELQQLKPCWYKSSKALTDASTALHQLEDLIAACDIFKLNFHTIDLILHLYFGDNAKQYLSTSYLSDIKTLQILYQAAVYIILLFSLSTEMATFNFSYTKDRKLTINLAEYGSLNAEFIYTSHQLSNQIEDMLQKKYSKMAETKFDAIIETIYKIEGACSDYTSQYQKDWKELLNAPICQVRSSIINFSPEATFDKDFNQNLENLLTYLIRYICPTLYCIPWLNAWFHNFTLSLQSSTTAEELKLKLESAANTVYNIFLPFFDDSEYAPLLTQLGLILNQECLSKLFTYKHAPKAALITSFIKLYNHIQTFKNELTTEQIQVLKGWELSDTITLNSRKISWPSLKGDIANHNWSSLYEGLKVLAMSHNIPAWYQNSMYYLLSPTGYISLLTSYLEIMLHQISKGTLSLKKSKIQKVANILATNLKLNCQTTPQDIHLNYQFTLHVQEGMVPINVKFSLTLTGMTDYSENISQENIEQVKLNLTPGTLYVSRNKYLADFCNNLSFTA